LGQTKNKLQNLSSDPSRRITGSMRIPPRCLRKMEGEKEEEGKERGKKDKGDGGKERKSGGKGMKRGEEGREKREDGVAKGRKKKMERGGWE